MKKTPPSNFWKGKKVLVTGGAGFVGSHVVERLVWNGASVTAFDNLQNGSLKNLKAVRKDVAFVKADCADSIAITKACKGQDVVLNLAARVGGIEYNRLHQGTMLRDNLLIGSVVLEAARKMNVERFLVVSSACVYSHDCPVPTPETEGFVGEPEITNEGYGWAKRMAEKLGKYYAEEFGMKVGIVRPYNTYGPRDHFDPQLSHVIPSLIKRTFENKSSITVWGSGNQTRAFLYVEDLAEGMMLATENYPVPDAVNLGTDEEISIKNLVKKILAITGKKMPIHFDRSKPDGSPRRNSDNKKAKKTTHFTAKISLDEGLQKTIEWYRNNYAKISL